MIYLPKTSYTFFVFRHDKRSHIGKQKVTEKEKEKIKVRQESQKTILFVVFFMGL